MIKTTSWQLGLPGKVSLVNALSSITRLVLENLKYVVSVDLFKENGRSHWYPCFVRLN